MFLDPDLALRRGLELPDRGDLLELVDAPLAGPECLGPVLGGSDDQDDVLADLDVPVPVDDQDFDHVEVLQGPLPDRSEEHTSELQSRLHLVCRLLLEKKKKKQYPTCA